VFCIFLFLCAASLFGTIIAQVNEIVAQLTTKKKDLETILASYVFVKPRLYVYRQPKLKILHEITRDAARLDTNTMFRIREWERFQFAIDYQHQQVRSVWKDLMRKYLTLSAGQHKKILERTIPDALKLSIARKIENNLFSKVLTPLCMG
jgi:hypothetical protein